jgi:signal transduction histidine kinase/CheY-like chemotaxis protein
MGQVSTESKLEEALLSLKQERHERAAAEARVLALEDRYERLKVRFEREVQARTQLQLLFKNVTSCLPSAFLVENSEGRVLCVHPLYCELFQLRIDPARLEGTDLRAIEKNACALFIEPAAYVERLEEIRTRGVEVRGDILELSSGAIWSRDSLPVELGPKDRGWVHILRDVTGERAQLAALRKAQTEASNAQKAALGFLDAVSHELKTPHAALLGLISLLKDEDKSLEPAQMVSRLALNAELMGHLIQDISTFAQLDEGKLRLSEGPVSPSSLLWQVADQMRQVAVDKGLELVVLDDERLPTAVLGDESRIRQLLVGLVGNAIKFTKEGVVTLRASRTSSEKPDEITYEVKDTGIGIQEAERSRVFERYFRGHLDVPGTGLGLSICRDLVHLMGGRIGLDSEVGRGTCVFFTLVQPALSDTSPSDLDHHVPRSRMSVPPLADQGAKILLVEDDVGNRRLITRLLEVSGYVVQAVASAEEALVLLERSYFDVLVTDLSMPGMDGVELVGTLRAREQSTLRAPTPAVVITAYPLSEYQERCREVGVDVFLSKPINGTALRRALARLSRPPPRILLVDDSWDARILLEVCLKQYPSPLEIHAANSGATAIAACRERDFAVIFIDVLMPGMGGVETLKKIREETHHKNVRIIAVTGLSDRAQLEQLKVSGFDDVLTKPIDRHKVHKTVREALRDSVIIRRPRDERAAMGAAVTLLQLETVSAVEVSGAR